MSRTYSTLKHYVQGEHLTYEQFGQLIGVSQSYAYRLVNLQRRPGGRLAARISEMTGISMRRLVLAKVA